MAFELPKLKYSFDALEPNIDAKTMEIHYGKHHNGYTNNLNNAISGTELENSSIEEILKNLDLDNNSVRNNAGGFFNHNLFWEIMGPNCGGTPSGEIAEAIDSNFDSFENFKESFKKSAATRFGSGWAWLCSDNGTLSVCSTSNQDNPLMGAEVCGCECGTPIMGVDVWEHAYYLKYQNLRGDYLNAFFNVVNWSEVSRRYAETK